MNKFGNSIQVWHFYRGKCCPFLGTFGVWYRETTDAVSRYLSQKIRYWAILNNIEYSAGTNA